VARPSLYEVALPDKHASLRRLKQPYVALIVGSALLGGYSVLNWFSSASLLQDPAIGTPALSQFDDRLPRADEPIQPIPFPADLAPQKVELGKRLFYEPRLSRNNRIACSNCHDLDTGGTDRAARSIGIDGAVGTVNTPTVFNAALNFKQFWDGRADSLEEQIDGPIHNPIEMGSSWAEITAKLQEDLQYRRAFAALYPNGLTSAAIKDALATFERSLLTPDSRFDQFLRGNSEALTENERTGYRLFKQYGCVVCHQGANVGGNMFQKFGILGDYFADRGHRTAADHGRQNLSGHEAHRHIFKVPSLRLAALTPPYFHDGSIGTLDEAVRIMAQYQLGRSLAAHEIASIVAFLNTLPGVYRGEGS
jgi:cytochrome c peroxidase